MNIPKNLHHLLVNRGYDRLLKSPKWLEAHDRVRKPRAQPPEPWWLISSQPRRLCWLELESCPEAPGAELWGAQQSGGCHWESGTAWLSLGSYCSLFSGEKGGWGRAPQGGRSLCSDGFLHLLFLHQLLTEAPSASGDRKLKH